MRKVLPILLLALAFLSCSPRGGKYVQITGTAQSVEYAVKFNTAGVEVPVEEIRDSIDAILTKIDFSLSGYNKQSLLARFNAGEVIRPNDLFIEMYRLGYRMWERSGGAVDCAAAPLYDVWGFGFKNSLFPTDEEISALLGKTGQKNLPPELPIAPDGTLDPAAMGYPKLNYNAIAQGYTSDVIARYLYRLGVKDMLVDIGEIWCDGLNPSGQPWSVGVDRPGEEYKDVWSSGGRPVGITTSGNYRKFFVRDGKKYSHTINPITGYPVQHSLLSATVVSTVSAAESDAVATWCMVVGLDASREIILNDPALEGYLTYANASGDMEEWMSPGFTLRN
ncbi:MAG: FAD:protein FMN transferase [Bacteroidales bacterium]|nr:FAD:protein FMN transferase [Bacteroidales bacterium]